MGFVQVETKKGTAPIQTNPWIDNSFDNVNRSNVQSEPNSRKILYSISGFLILIHFNVGITFYWIMSNVINRSKLSNVNKTFGQASSEFYWSEYLCSFYVISSSFKAKRLEWILYCFSPQQRATWSNILAPINKQNDREIYFLWN